MAKLTKKQKARIAALINTIETSHIMLDSKATENRQLWVIEKDTATLNLFNEFGIELPTLSIIKKWSA
ncbi:MAG: hypothetical protein NZ811_00035 [Gammaproteobacteria bacterium]|nr:hypothetical protein [Gammaproteobacteria bacterium]